MCLMEACFGGQFYDPGLIWCIESPQAATPLSGTLCASYLRTDGITTQHRIGCISQKACYQYCGLLPDYAPWVPCTRNIHPYIHMHTLCTQTRASHVPLYLLWVHSFTVLCICHWYLRAEDVMPHNQ